MEKTLEQLVKMLQEVAPEIWAVALRQVYAQVAVNALWVVATTIAAILIWYAGKIFIVPNQNYYPVHRQEVKAQEDRMYYNALTFAVWFVFICIFVLDGIVPKLMNPNWYAIEALRSLLR